MIIKGVISKARYGRNGRSCVITDGSTDYSFFTNEDVFPGECVVVEGDIEDSKIDARSVIGLSEKDAIETYENVKEALARTVEVAEEGLVEDGIADKLRASIRKAATELMTARKLGRFVLLRFHGDADGISGAFALTGIVRCKSFQQNSAIYSVRDALKDISMVGQENRPLVVLLDFGANDASSEGLNLLKAAGIDYIIIDHHPLGSKIDPNLISPFIHSQNSSHYTAGYLACEIAVACGMNRGQGLELAKVACAGDKSQLIPNGDEEKKKAMVLDYLAAHISFGNNLDFYKKVMEKDELFNSIAQQADESIQEAADRAIEKSKRTDGGGNDVVTFPLDMIVKKGEWPSASKVTTRVFETLSGGKAFVCIGYTERSVIMRLNDKAVEHGLSANTIAQHINRNMKDFVVGGGGHARAGAIRVRAGFAKEVLGEVLRKIRGQ